MNGPKTIEDCYRTNEIYWTTFIKNSIVLIIQYSSIENLFSVGIAEVKENIRIPRNLFKQDMEILTREEPAIREVRYTSIIIIMNH